MGHSPGDLSWKAEPERGGFRNILIIVLFILVIGLFAAVGYVVTQVRSAVAAAEQSSEKVRVHDAALANLTEQVSRLEGAVNRTSKQTEKTIADLQSKVKAHPQDARAVEKEVLSKTQQMVERLSAEQKTAMVRMNGEVEQLKSATSTAESKLGSLTGEVSGVKTEVSSAKSELQKAIADLKSVRGDLGVQSGLIATNASELAALKRLGERNYYEFDLKKSKDLFHVGGVALKLKGTDARHNRYTLEVIADDRLTLKKDRSVNEPVQFYGEGSRRIPSEIVVNQVSKDRIVGYLSTPKAQPRQTN